ncbi:MAG: polyprenyl synthetase family protein [Candidatus Omnitrophica bacterium]|nr:polyprenyl synthetase family protein [Candidatus Omnitrophota bacterium]MDD5352169.1 polyprenyl synthetase family protein [Candidatus Omnitrophota bacterium]MDD5549767.1 polyprenyl synthetase family protein [Candidatus Omnitrophota bacterium]
MLHKIKNQIDKELKSFIRKTDKIYSLSKISPLLFKHLREFVLRDGKRVRPILFITAYLGFAKKAAANLYSSAIGIELLHDFLLIHDDIIDKSDTRRNKPSLHAMFNNYLASYKNIKFNGQDLAIVGGDVLYAISLLAFLSIKEERKRKEEALKKFIESVMYTGGGEFIELIYGLKDIKKITKQDIIKVYDYKTARYTFAFPLSMGAILAGANQKQTEKLFQYGICLGRAFQIKDDLISMFKNKKEIGKSPLTDLKEAKKTLIIWYAYNHTENNNKQLIRIIFSKKDADKQDLSKIQEIIVASGALKYAEEEISRLIQQAQILLNATAMKLCHKESLNTFIEELLNI